MLEATQGRRPVTLDHYHYYLEQRRAFLDFQQNFNPDHSPIPEMGADHAHWHTEAANRLEEIEHLARIANIRKSQIKRLEAAGAIRMQQLAETTTDRIPKLDRPRYEVLPPPSPNGRLLGHLVEFHRREDKPKWWRSTAGTR